MYERRLIRLFSAIVVLLVVVVARAFWFQVVSAQEIVRRNEAALRGIRTVMPRRGEVLWADGSPAVRNAPRCVVRIDWAKFDAVRLRCGKCGEVSTKKDQPASACRECGATGAWVEAPKPDRDVLATILGVPRADLDASLAQVAATWRIERWRSIDLFESGSIPREAALRLATRAAEFPGVDVSTEPGRETDPEIAAVAGRASLAWREDVVALTSETRETEGLHRYTPEEARRLLVGRSGMEATFDERFRGVPGISERPPGRAGEPPEPEVVVRPVEDGLPLRTTLVRGVQAVANDVVRREGVPASAAVVLDVRDGAIVAIAARSDDPYFHAIQGLMPGSVFKLVGALAVLESPIAPEATLDCEGSGRLRPGLPYRCTGRHPGIGLAEAFAHSCNYYFMHRAEDVGAAAFADAHHRLGLDLRLSLGLGVATHLGGIARFDRNTAQLGIGQAEALASPLQVATAYARIAAGGRRIVPFLDRDAGPPPESRGTDPVLARHAAFLIDASRQVVVHGTARSVHSLDAIEAAGKSGTAEVDVKEGRLQHTWFAGFAPASAPRFVAVVVHERMTREHGATFAGPDVARLLEAALRER